MHEQLSLDQMRGVLAAVEAALGRRVGVANSCGMGRMARAEALYCLDAAPAIARS